MSALTHLQRLEAEAKRRLAENLAGLDGLTVGVVGLGVIGLAVAQAFHRMGARIAYFDPAPRDEKAAAAMDAKSLALDELLRTADVVTLHVPSSSETRGLIGRTAPADVKRGALLVNTARGDIVDEAALVEALEDGRLGGVGLDVFAREPAVPPALVRHPRAVVLPHLGSATTATRRAMAGLAVRNVRAVLAGQPAVTPIGRR